MPTTSEVPLSVCVVWTEDDGPLTPLLEGLAAQTHGPESFELVLVDASERGVDLPELEFAVRVVRGASTLSYGALRNLAWRAAGAQSITFLGADLVPAPLWVEALRSTLLRGRRVVVGGWLPTPGSVSDGSPLRRALWWSPRPLPLVTSDQLGCLRADLERIGGFDELVTDPVACDTLLAARLVEAGADVFRARHAFVYFAAEDSALGDHRAAVRTTLAVLAEHPRARARMLLGGVAWRRQHVEAALLLAGLGLGLAGRDRRALALTAPWLHDRTCLAPVVGGPRRKWALLPGALVADLSEAVLTTSERLRPPR